MIHGRARARLGFFVLALAVVTLAHPAPARSQNSPDSLVIPEPVGHVNDFAGVMDEPSRAKLESFLAQVQQKTGAELAVLTVKNTGPIDPMEYKVRVFERWKLGKKGEDNGLLMLVAVEQTTVRFETGYGLEGVLPDGLQSRIYRDVMRPYLRNGDMAGGITQGMLASAARIAKEKDVTLEWDGTELRYSDPGEERGMSPRTMLFLILVFFFVMSIMARIGGAGYRRRRGGGWWIGPMMGGGGWGGGGWGGGGWGGGGVGGGGGGGGGFGGGGGGGFGGFGGGSSGGGGGGGGGSGGW